ncbi:charged multivesicular body protein 6-A-like [Hydractinia symbiolongicarpus]|uniref:charged multivesicular body protein 6-A-like n=1 Tax=Hydractinia symbiolongicarpus TaxID=13093 RepID=UPI00254E4800|nr:charged multivesicular body protein 6-A-like [Hydractinia symbiolongicarpus]
MGGLFSKKKADHPKQQPNRITEQDKAVLSLKQQRDKLKQYQKKINLNLEKERQVAKSLLKDGKKEKAKLLLKKKHYQENLLKKTDDSLEAIDKLIHEVEFAQVEMKVVEGLKQGNEALKKLHEVMTLEDVEKIMDDTKEAVEYQNEIDALIGGGLTDEDEEDILAELEELTKDVELPSVPEHELTNVDDQLPDVPVQEPVKKAVKREAVAAT